MSASLARDRRPAPVQRVDPQSTLPLLGAAKGPAQVHTPDGDWILGLIGKAIERVYAEKKGNAAREMGMDASYLNRLLAADGHLSVRKLGLLPDDFWLALVDELRAHFKVDNDAERLDRALDGIAAGLKVVGEIARKGLR